MRSDSHTTAASAQLPPLVPPHHANADEAQNEEGRADAQQAVLHYLQHPNTGEELLLEHVGRFLIQHGRLGGDSGSR